jgi:uncharacterized protein
MRHLFVDTGAWYALVDGKDPDHGSARKFFEKNRIPLITTNFIFDETVTLLRKRLGWPVAHEFGRRLKESGFAGLLSVTESDEELAWEIFRKYRDHDFSYTDCTSFAVMKRLGIKTAFTFDGHFVSMKFTAVPGPG